MLTIGAAGLAWGLAGGGPTLIWIGASAAASGFLVFVVPVAIALVRARGAPGTLLALRTAALALAITVVLGLFLVAVLQGWIRVPEHTRWVDTHAA